MKEKTKKTFEDFKKFISKGNVIDLSIGVIMGSAFGAITSAFSNILLSLATWGVPGGLNGLITILPALNSKQVSPLGKEYQMITSLQYIEGITINDTTYTTAQLSTLYVSKGGNYYYKGAAIIDWGSFINAIISFIIIALVLFVIVKVYSYLKTKRELLEKKKLELYYQKHPEKRPPVKEEGAPKITELDILMEINAGIKKLNESKD